MAGSSPSHMTRNGTQDACFLAITREPTLYGVPLVSFLVATIVAALGFDLTVRYNLFWRAGICLTFAGITLYAMAALTSWEPQWRKILLAWLNVRGPGVLSPHTRAWGGVTFRPWPVAIQHNLREMQDYAG